MMYTVQQIFDIACDLIDERLATGAIDANTTAVYKTRTPGIMNIFQNENFKSGDLYKTFEIVCVPATTATWVKQTMPPDFKSVDQIIEITSDGANYRESTGYKWEGRSDLYISSLFEGTIRIVYHPVPIPITLITQTLEVDEITSIGAAYFLAAHLLLVEDPASASFFNGRHMEYMLKVKPKNPAPIEEIADVYRTRWE